MSPLPATDPRQVPQLRKRLIWWFAFASAAALLATVLTTRTLLQAEASQAANAAVEQEVEEFQTFMENTATHAPAQLIEAYLQVQIPSSDEAMVGVDGARVFTVAGSPIELQPAEVAAMQGTSGIYQREGTQGGEQLHWARMTLDNPAGQADFIVAVSTAQAHAAIQRTIAIVSAIGAVGVLISTLLAWVMSATVFTPLRKLRGEIIKASTQGSTIDVASIPGAETQDLATVVNVALHNARTSHAAPAGGDSA
ncbi:hypothetical protein NQ015_03825 [Corynebacterium sp. 153RC1]|uniref:hypothetical protein n=1 Tax=unclassified Corynebacterium TaxID=2624378 RepID=UPI00211C2C76|nr:MULTISPECIES: hypothetical protein [unclassified Corynebacterium]MCQ9369881.1 hypothetical protein [Corynebacterium sp. 35RC1]MCQ9352000.1 hypothetical protein [Corynebacterium sp. 209RC1]MCQ9353749.1 hypothetical protein [Corynebacterium sp. 1222RC1]MCQ9356267.1 hypothetical protein [Corynebacterium sp. 122RC1]MCQ9358369.1 hypothetical protein [Corynebacterium sp. 142RC1]